MIKDVTGIAPASVAPGNSHEPAGQKRAEPAHPKPVPEPSPDEKPADRTALDQAVGKVREVFQAAAPRVQFEVDADLHRVVVKIVNGESGELIRQIPEEEILRLARSLEEAKGLLLKEQA